MTPQKCSYSEAGTFKTFDFKLYTYPSSVSESLTAAQRWKTDFWALRPFRHFIRVIFGQKYMEKKQKDKKTKKTKKTKKEKRTKSTKRQKRPKVKSKIGLKSRIFWCLLTWVRSRVPWSAHLQRPPHQYHFKWFEIYIYMEWKSEWSPPPFWEFASHNPVPIQSSSSACKKLLTFENLEVLPPYAKWSRRFVIHKQIFGFCYSQTDLILLFPNRSCFVIPKQFLPIIQYSKSRLKTKAQPESLVWNLLVLFESKF